MVTTKSFNIGCEFQSYSAKLSSAKSMNHHRFRDKQEIETWIDRKRDILRQIERKREGDKDGKKVKQI